MVYYSGSLFHRYCVCCFININYKNLGISVVTRVFTVGNVKDEFTYAVYKNIINVSFLILVAPSTVCDSCILLTVSLVAFFFGHFG